MMRMSISSVQGPYGESLGLSLKFENMPPNRDLIVEFRDGLGLLIYSAEENTRSGTENLSIIFSDQFNQNPTIAACLAVTGNCYYIVPPEDGFIFSIGTDPGELYGCDIRVRYS
jgi:hypothetical protein